MAILRFQVEISSTAVVLIFVAVLRFRIEISSIDVALVFCGDFKVSDLRLLRQLLF